MTMTIITTFTVMVILYFTREKGLWAKWLTRQPQSQRKYKNILPPHLNDLHNTSPDPTAETVLGTEAGPLVQPLPYPPARIGGPLPQFHGRRASLPTMWLKTPPLTATERINTGPPNDILNREDGGVMERVGGQRRRSIPTIWWGGETPTHLQSGKRLLLPVEWRVGDGAQRTRKMGLHTWRRERWALEEQGGGEEEEDDQDEDQD
ncbi:hypothetical protein DFH27DRAFT_609928 [Peziza echinospora]|nr:hypothetical protein DFH27DRAFT_609928 [Peziza echinospora]